MTEVGYVQLETEVWYEAGSVQLVTEVGSVQLETEVWYEAGSVQLVTEVCSIQLVTVVGSAPSWRLRFGMRLTLFNW